MAMITLSEYARRHGKDRGNLYRKYKKGDFQSAVKMGRDIWIDEDEPLVDHRVKSGQYVGWRKMYDYQKRYRDRKRQEREAEQEQSE